MLFSLFCLFVCLLFGFFLGSGRLSYSVPLFFAILFSSVALSDAACVSGNFSRDTLYTMRPLPSLPSNCRWDGYRVYCGEGTGCSSQTCHCVPANEMAQSACPGVIRINSTMYYTNRTIQGVNPPYNPENSGCTNGSLSPVCHYLTRCDTKCEADSIACGAAGKYWDSPNCACGDPPPQDTTWHCQNAGGPEEGGFGSPYYAKIFKCIAGTCENMRDLHGSCEDWGFCPPGVEDCVIADSLGRPPCGRSGQRFTTSARCTYACGDGKDLSCKPVSTGYVAGNIYAGECPDKVPGGCRPSSSSSGASSSASSSPSSSPSYSSPKADTVHFAGGDDDWEIDYSTILSAILDTLHHANAQRDFEIDLQNAAKIDLDKIGEYASFGYTELQKQTSKLNSIASDGLPYPLDVKQDISDSKDLLDNINSFLRSDSLLSRKPDTSYNPLLRDIKAAIDSIDLSVSPPSDSGGGGSLFERDSAFAKWWSKYYADSAQTNSVVGKALKDFVPSRDSVRASDCNGFVGCMSVYSDMAYCSTAWGVSMSDCVEGGTPIDNVINVETSILDKITKAFWGPDTVDFGEPDDSDTNVVYPPAKDSAESWIGSAFRSLFSPESTAAIINKVDSMKTAAEAAQKDSVKIQPDSLWLDSSAAAQYARSMLLPSGTGTNCFVCHADLGTFGGLVSNNLSIHIDFSNFGGYNFCDIVRAVIKIMTFVVCMSLTLGSWAAAFGYNPKNDA